MANENITQVILGDIELYQNGERANSENLNRPIIQLRDNQVSQNTMLNEVYAVLSGDNLNLDSIQEIITKLEEFNTTLLSDDSAFDTIQELVNEIKIQQTAITALEDAGTTNSTGEVSEFLGSISVAETLNITGVATLGDDLSIGGTISAPDSLLDIDSSLDITGNVTVGGNLASTDNLLDIIGAVTISDTLAVNGIVTSGGNELATQNWVLINGGGGGDTGGGVEITKNFEYVGDGAETEFLADFVGESISVFMEGVLQNPDTYVLWYDDGEGLVTSGIAGVKVVFTVAPAVSNTITIVAYGGADVYTKTQIDLKITDTLADINQLDQIIGREDILSMEYVGGADSNKLSKITYNNNYSQIFSYNVIDKMEFIDHQIANVNSAYSTMTYNATTNKLEQVIFTSSARI